MQKRERDQLALIVAGAALAYALFFRRGQGKIPTDVIALDEPALLQLAATRL